MGGIQYVKAGKVDDFCLKYALVPHARIKKLRIGEREVNVSGLLMYLVHGNSMSSFGVRSGQRVFVELLNSNMKNSITTHPMLMFSIIGTSKWQSQYKLRKFIDYVEIGVTDWGMVYDANSERITTMNRDAFILAMQQKEHKVRLGQERHILSVTFNEHARAFEYSLHPVSSLYGIVKYAA